MTKQPPFRSTFTQALADTVMDDSRSGTDRATRPTMDTSTLPEVEAVLALSPMQAEILAPLAGKVQRFAWGEATAEAFAMAGAPAHAHCEPKPSLLWAMLAQHLNPKEESPC